MSVESRLRYLEDATAIWDKAIEMRKHRDAWRRYAYTGKNRPRDVITTNEDPIGETYIDTLKKRLDETTAILMTFMDREREVIGSPGSPFNVDQVLLNKAQAEVSKNLVHL